MNDYGISLGRVFGIEIRIDYTWFILLGLIVITFSAGLVPQLLPELSSAQAFWFGLVLSLLFFLSVVAHELAHSVYAKRQGLKIDRLTLFVFGGAAELQEEPKRPRQEFIMAGLGPLTSILVGIIFMVVGMFGYVINSQYVIAAGVSLAAINIVLALFNLLPGFPLDGGRMFRATVWAITKNLEKATRFATAGGKILAFGLIAYGVLMLFGGALFSGAWLMLIGFFLLQAAEMSYKQTVAQIVLQNVTVGELMSREFTPVLRSTTVLDFIRQNVVRRKQTDFPIEPEAGKPAGMIVLDQVQGADEDAPVGAYAVDGKVAVYPRDSATKALTILAKTGLSKLPVVDHSKLVGVISLESIQAYLAGKTTLLTSGHKGY